MEGSAPAEPANLEEPGGRRNGDLYVSRLSDLAVLLESGARAKR
jgi:hypothetical protein